MKRLKNALILCLTLCAAAFAGVSCGSGNYETLKGDPTGMRIYTLDNGLKVYLSVMKDEPRIQTFIAVRTGSKNDPNETTGLSHYLEHLMFKGTDSYGTVNYEAEKPLLDSISAAYEKYRTLTDPEERKAQYALIDSLSYAASEYFVANEYDKIMASMGATGSNAFTSNDATVYTENIPSNQVEAWAKVQSDRFKNLVIRGFHTELESVYEECNLGLSSDSGNAIDTLFFALFDKHPYGLQTTIGTQEDLKNPSIVNIMKHYKNFYVPNNVAICMAGDFNPDEVIKTIRKYFGDWKKNDNLKMLDFEDEEPIKEHIEKTLYGQQSPFVFIGWRFPGTHPYGKEMTYFADTLAMLNSVLYNGQAGLLDLAVNRPGKVLGSGSTLFSLADYNLFILFIDPKAGQTIDEAKALVMEQIEKVKSGDFDEELITATINNIKKREITKLNSYTSRASIAYDAFINNIPWADVIGETDRIAKITKDDIVKFANRYLGDNYVQVNKLVGEQAGVRKLDKPAITSIRTNRDTSSAFLREVTALAEAAKPIEPVFVDFEKEMTVSAIGENQKFFYKHNDDNELFNLNYVFDYGSNNDYALPYALEYFRALGTDSLTADQISAKCYTLASNFGANAGSTSVNVAVSGLGSNMDAVNALFEELLANAKGDEDLLDAMKANWVRAKLNDKTDKSQNEIAVNYYAVYGPVNPMTADLKPADIMKLTSDELIGKVKDLFTHKYDVVYYGPLSEKEFVEKYQAMHKAEANLKPFPPVVSLEAWNTSEAAVYIAPYKANQINMYKIASYGPDDFSYEDDAVISLYDDYFGSGMSSIVFQDIREAKGLAYHAAAFTSLPGRKGGVPFYTARVYTQNDKMRDAMNAFDEILTDMPVVQKSFDVAKSNMLQKLATKRYKGASVIWYYRQLMEMGYPTDFAKIRYEKTKDLTLDDIVRYHDTYIKGRPFVTGILGNVKELDLSSIDKSYGKIQILRTEDIFGY